MKNHWLSHSSILCLCLIGSAVFAQDPSSFEPSEDCLECHDDIPELINKTVHAPLFEVNCESCHGTSEEHMDEPEADNINTPLGGLGQKVCLSCHQSSVHPKHMSGTAQLTCSDCHDMHKHQKPNVALLSDTLDATCLSCHLEHRSIENRPFGHKLGRGGMSCISCHQAHQRPGQVLTASPEQMCLNCHAEKKGPFVFEHVQGVVGDCLSCHQVHGSSNPKQLTRTRVSQLCLECHSQTTQPIFGSQPPAIHDMRSPRYQNCTTCHGAIHGSNRSHLLLK